MKPISIRQYRTVDLVIWAVILAVFEAVTVLAASRWFPGELYTVSQVVAVLCIVMMRWGGWAAVHAVAGGLVFCLASGASLGQLAVYCAGNCFALAALFLFRFRDKEEVREKVPFTVLFVVLAFCGAQLGRWIVSLFFGGALDSVGSFFLADSLSLVYALVVVLIARRVDGLFEDQKNYLVRTEDERKRQDVPEEFGGDYYG